MNMLRPIPVCKCENPVKKNESWAICCTCLKVLRERSDNIKKYIRADSD